MNRQLGITLCCTLLALGTSGVRCHAQQAGMQEMPELRPDRPHLPVAAPEDRLIRLRTETVDVPRVDVAANAARTRAGLARLGLRPNQPAYYLVHTRLPAARGLLADMGARGGRVVSYVPRNTYIVRGNQAAVNGIRALPGVDLVTLYQPFHRISPQLAARLRSSPRTVEVYVLLFSDQDPDAATRTFAAIGGQEMGRFPSPYGPLLDVRFPASAVTRLADMPGVQWVEERPAFRLLNDEASGFTVGGLPQGGAPSGGVMQIKPVWDRGLTGGGMVVGHADTGLDSGADGPTMHPDFRGRIAAAFGWSRLGALAYHTDNIATYTAGPNYDAVKFVPVSSGSVMGIYMILQSGVAGFGNNSGKIGCAIYSDSGGKPGTVLANGTGASISARTLQGTAQAYWVGFASPALTINVPYWLVLNFGTETGSVGIASTFDGASTHRRSTDGTTWGAADSANWYYYILSSDLWNDTDGHGTHTAGSILGNGAASSPNVGQFRGPAYQATLVHQSLNNASGVLTLPSDISCLFGQAYLFGACVHSNSWGSSNSLDHGLYLANCMQTDAFTWDNPEMLVCFAAGNDGSAAGTIAPPATAKNCLSVGASQGARAGDINTLRPASSRGPCGDGRMKPDLVAPGGLIISCRSRQPGASTGSGVYDANYVYESGTSMATPLTAGAATLARQYFLAYRGFDPSAALVKAALIHGATNILGTAPDYNEGWGRLNLFNSLFPSVPTYFTDARAGSNMSIVNPSRLSVEARVTANSQSYPLKATLVWSDPAAAPQAAVALINDLNLRIYRRNSDNSADDTANPPYIYYPKLVGGTTGNDNRNNVEQVEVAGANLVVGRVYRVEVSAPSLDATYSTQPFALIVSGGLISPTPVTITDGRAERQEEGVALSWRVAEGADAAAFRVLRASAPEGPFTRVSHGLVPAQAGRDGYSYRDPTAPLAACYYELEIVNQEGAAERYGPIRCSGHVRAARR